MLSCPYYRFQSEKIEPLWHGEKKAVTFINTVKHCPEAHTDTIPFKCFWIASTWFHNNRYYNGTIHSIDNVIVLSDLVESSGYSSKTLKKGSCPYAPLDEVLRYGVKAALLSWLSRTFNIFEIYTSFITPQTIVLGYMDNTCDTKFKLYLMD